MAKILEARLTDEFISPSEISGVIHSKFRKVLNVLFQMPSGSPRLITIITPETKGIPDSITVSAEYFSRIRVLPVGHRLQGKQLKFHFENVSEILIGDVQCLRPSKLLIDGTETNTLMPVNFERLIKEMELYSRDALPRSDFSAWNLRQENETIMMLQQFAECWQVHNIMGMEIILQKYVGLGIGLTPSCDDAFLGMIAIYSGARLYAGRWDGENHFKPWRALPGIDFLTPFNQLLLNRTTDVSLKYLNCSQEGRFSDVIINLIKVVFSESGEGLPACIKAVSQTGESSGIDVLLGMEIACQKLLKNERIPGF